MKAYFSLLFLKDRAVIFFPPNCMEIWTNFQENVLIESSWLLFNTIKNIEFIISIYLQKKSCLDPFLCST